MSHLFKGSQLWSTMSSLNLLFVLLLSMIDHINPNLVSCDGETCDCPSNSGEICILDCGREDICKEQTLNCRGGDPCEIRCDAKASCSSGAVINANTATDVTIICGADDSCKDGIQISCGTGHCELQCKGSTSCESWGEIDVTRAASFECIGDCPEEIPSSFTAETNPYTNPQIIVPVNPGYYGQDCAWGNDDNPPDECSVFGQVITDNGEGKIECSENYDCCLCKSITCGKANGRSPCEDFSCNGDQSCLGVKDIRLYGDADGGVTLSCNGDESCIGTKITGTNIKEIGCSGDNACMHSIFEFDCLRDEPCAVGCGGDYACAGNPKDSGLETTRFTIGNTEGIECASHGCQYGVFNLRSNVGGGSILCGGESACIGAEISINNIDMIICGGVNACKDAYILVIDPMEDFSVECSGPHSCSGLTLEIVVSNGVSFFKGIGCGDFGCVGAHFAIYNTGNQFVTIENLECEAPSACTNAVFDFDGGVGFENCKCGESLLNSCDGISGISSCMSGLAKVECSGTAACSNLQQQLRNIENDFELLCSDRASCKSFWLQIVLSDNQRSSTNVIKGYKCDSDESCMDAIIQINNEQNGVSVEIETIECGGTASCKNALFIIDGDVNVNEIACNGQQSCDGCLVQYAPGNTIIPCANFLPTQYQD